MRIRCLLGIHRFEWDKTTVKEIEVSRLAVSDMFSSNYPPAIRRPIAFRDCSLCGLREQKWMD